MGRPGFRPRGLCPKWVTSDKTHSEYKESAYPSDSRHSSGRRFPPLRANSGHDAVGNARITDATPEGVVSNGMGRWRPGSITPGNGAFDVNLNAAMTYDGPWDPISGSVDSREIRCRILRV